MASSLVGVSNLCWHQCRPERSGNITGTPSLGQQKDGVYEPAGRHAIVAEAARRHGFDVLDLLPGFLAAGNGDLQALRGRCTGMHPDERGHEVAAQLLFDHFAESRGLH